MTSNSSGSYVLVVHNAYGAATSSPPAVLNVIGGPPYIVQQPAPVNLAAGGTAHFTVVAGGALPYSYLWSLDGMPIPGATDATLVVSPIEPGDVGSYTVLVTNPHGSTNSDPAVLTLAAPPNVYAATVMAMNPYAYWPLNDTNGGICTDIASGLNGTFVGAPVTLGPGLTNGGFGPSHMSYFTGVSGGGGAGFYVNCGTQVELNQVANTIIAWENTALNGNHPAIVDKGDNTWRLQQSAPVEWTEEGPSPMLGTPNPDYFGPPINPPNGLMDGQWHMLVGVLDNGAKSFYFDNQLVETANVGGRVLSNGVPIFIGENSEAGGRIFGGYLADITLFNRGLSASEVSNLWQVANAGASAPVIGDQPLSQTLTAGGPATFNVAPNAGSGPFFYAWRHNSTPLPGATSRSLIIPAATYGDAGTYDVVVSNSVSSVISQPAVLTVAVPQNFANLTNGLVLHLPFDGNFNDTSGHGHNGSGVGSPAFIAGKLGQGVHVTNGLTVSYVTVPDSSDFNFGAPPSTDMSVSFWVRYTGTPNDLPIIGNAGYTGYVTPAPATYNPGWVFTDDFGHPEWFLYAQDALGARAADPVPNSPATDDGQWHNIVLSAQFAYQGLISTYVDGVLDSVIENSVPDPNGDWPSVMNSVDTSEPITLGNDVTGAYKVQGGYDIDDVGIWNRALSRTEAESIYTAAQAGHSFDVAGAPIILISVTLVNSQVVISYSGGTLQSAPSPAGPWGAVGGASPPSYSTTPIIGGARFYRVHP